jgi:GNAT superfamily N-acetyltransferase
MEPKLMPTARPAVTLRVANPADAAAFASLATQLGYTSSAAQIEARMTAMLPDPQHLILAAVSMDRIVGWAHASICHLVEIDMFVEIRGIIVDESCRRRGVGGALLRELESWAHRMGAHAVSVRANIIRHETHRFYAAHGYEMIKTQHAFRKRL